MKHVPSDYELAFRLDIRVETVRRMRANGESDEAITRYAKSRNGDDLEIESLLSAIYMVNGTLVTVQEIAKRLNLTPYYIVKKMLAYDITMQDIYDEYSLYNHRNRESVHQEKRVSHKQLVNGKYMSMTEISAELGVRISTFSSYVTNHLASYQQAYDYYTTHGVLTHNRQAQNHDVHGRLMTVRDIATELGISESLVRIRKKSLNSYEKVYDYYKTHGINVGKKSKLVSVHGRMMTINDIANELGVSYDTVRLRKRFMDSYEEVYDFYKNLDDTRKNCASATIHGVVMTMTQIAKECGITSNAIKYRMNKYNETPEQAYDHYIKKIMNRVPRQSRRKEV